VIVYKVTNKSNGKVYIGQTVRTLEVRWKEHTKNNSHCSALHSAISKYGEEVFEIEVIDFAQSIDELNEKEKHWISHYNSIAPNGYNLDSGGRNKVVSQITREKMSKSRSGGKYPHKGVPRTEEAKRKIGLANKGHPYYPGVFTEESRKRIALANSIPVNRYTKDGCYIDSFESACEAGRQLGICSSNISYACGGKRKTAGGFIWRYKNESAVSENRRSGGEDNIETTPRI
jgi:group I intron endonuclease